MNPVFSQDEQQVLIGLAFVLTVLIVSAVFALVMYGRPR